MTNVYSRMRQLIGTTAEWAADDLILENGEIGIEVIGASTYKLKVGDGTRKFSELPYAAAQGDITSVSAGSGLSGGGTEGDVSLAVNFGVVAPLASPAFTGTPTAPTPDVSDNSTHLSTTAWTRSYVGGYAAAYLPLTGGTITGGLTVNGAFQIAPGGSAQVPTMPTTDVSTHAATTAWVRDMLAVRGRSGAKWNYGSANAAVDPGAGNIAVQIGTGQNRTIAMSKTDATGTQRYLLLLQPGDDIVISVPADSAQPITGFARYDIVGQLADHGTWVSFPAHLIDTSGDGTPPAVGTPMLVTGFLNTATGDGPITGVSAGYGITGGGASGVVEVAIDTSIVAELSDLAAYLPLSGGVISGALTVTGALNVQGGYYFGAGDAAHPMLRRNGNAVEVVTGDQSAYAPINASDGTFYGSVSVQGAAFATNFAIGTGAPENAGTTGFGTTANGPYITYWGNGSAGAGRMDFTVGGAVRGSIDSGTGEFNWNAAINVPKPAAGENSTKVATTNWVRDQIASSGFTAGDVKTTASPLDQPGWYSCDGSIKSKTTDAALYAAIGDTFAIGGEGPDEFRVPDIDGRTVYGPDNGKGRLGNGRSGGFTGAAVLGATGGQQSHTLAKSEVPPPGAAFDVGSFLTYEAYGPSSGAAGAASNVYNASVGFGGQAHNTTSPGIVLRYLIKR